MSIEPWVVIANPSNEKCKEALDLLDSKKVPYALYHDYGHISGLLSGLHINRDDLPLIFINGELDNHMQGLEELQRYFSYYNY